MVNVSQAGSPLFPSVSGDTTASTREEMDKAIQVLQAHKNTWVKLPIAERVGIIDQLITALAATAPRWVEACQRAKGIQDTQFSGEEWMTGPWPILKHLRQLRTALMGISTFGKPAIPGRVATRADGQVVAGVFPQTIYDRIFFTGVTAEIWMQPGVSAETLPNPQALAYRDKQHEGKVALVLGAGNISSIGPYDILYKLFIEDHVALLKMNPVNAYLGPLIEEGFRPLIEPGYVRVVYGDAAGGAYLCEHEGIDEIHITGSDKTFDAIVFGSGAAGAARKARREPVLHKRITGELGNVSPLIIVPGPWTARDIAYQAEHIVTTLTLNAGFNCNATRAIIQHSSWEQREALLQAMRALLQRVPPRSAYYPGAQERQRSFVQAHSEAEQYGDREDHHLPWTFIADVEPGNAEDICFTTEAFCGLFCETALDASSTLEYIKRAVEFANQQLWGTLNVTLLVHPASLKDPVIAAAIEKAIADLRYGTIGLNYWAGAGFPLGTTTWGAFPGHPLEDIQSGVGVVHNALMFDRPQKSVLRAPFRSFPTPPWFVTRGRTANKVFSRLTAFEATPSIGKVPAIMWSAIVG